MKRDKIVTVAGRKFKLDDCENIYDFFLTLDFFKFHGDAGTFKIFKSGLRKVELGRYRHMWE